MARFRYKHIQSTVEDKIPSDLLDGELAVNRFKGKKRIFLKKITNFWVLLDNNYQVKQIQSMRRRSLLSASSGGGIDIDPTTGRGTIGDYEVVDLGLSNGLLFATCNVGTNTEIGYGKYYQYGKGSSTYMYGASDYTGAENPLASSADTATQVMGEGWRMPTQAELQDLIDNTNYKWVKNFNGRSISGATFTSKTNPNAYVFFPAAGQGYNAHINHIGTIGYYWSSTPSGSSSSSYAYHLYFKSDTNRVEYGGRSNGGSVRGVCEQPGKPMPPMSVLFVNKNDTTQKQIFEKDDWPSASDWTPIGIVVVPGSHKRYGGNTNGIMSLGCISSGGTIQTSGTTDDLTMQWSTSSADTSLSNYTTCDGSNSDGYAQYQADSGSTALSYHSTYNLAYPYTNLTATENSIIRAGSLSDYNGVTNTNKLNATASTYIAAAACKKFSTLGTSAGDWYLPAEGELAYLPSIRYQVNNTIDALNTKYGNVGTQLSGSYYWSSSEYDSGYVWGVTVSRGFVYSISKSSKYSVRPFMRL